MEREEKMQLREWSRPGPCQAGSVLAPGKSGELVAGMNKRRRHEFQAVRCFAIDFYILEDNFMTYRMSLRTNVSSRLEHWKKCSSPSQNRRVG